MITSVLSCDVHACYSQFKAGDQSYNTEFPNLAEKLTWTGNMLLYRTTGQEYLTNRTSAPQRTPQNNLVVRDCRMSLQFPGPLVPVVTNGYFDCDWDISCTYTLLCGFETLKYSLDILLWELNKSVRNVARNFVTYVLVCFDERWLMCRAAHVVQCSEWRSKSFRVFFG